MDKAKHIAGSLIIPVGVVFLIVTPFLGMGSPELALWLVVLAVVLVTARVRRRRRRTQAVPA